MMRLHQHEHCMVA